MRLKRLAYFHDRFTTDVAFKGAEAAGTCPTSSVRPHKADSDIFCRVWCIRLLHDLYQRHRDGPRGQWHQEKGEMRILQHFTIFVDHLVNRTQSSLFGNISNYLLEVYMVLHSTSYSHIIY